MADDDFKTCPFCKEKIRKEAVKCRFCGEWLEHNEQPGASSIETMPPPLSKPNEPPTTTAPVSCPHCKLANPPDAVRCDCGYDFSSGRMEATYLQTKTKTLNWISAVLLVVSALVMFACLVQVPWQRFTPGELTEKIVGGLVKFFFPVGMITWCVKRKGYRLLTFSIACAVCTAIFTYAYLDARHNAQEKAAKSDRLLASNINSLQEYIRQGAAGEVPEFKPTDDVNIDTLFQTIRDFYKEYLQDWHNMRHDIEALQEIDVFDSLLLTNKLNLESEIQKRIAGQQVIGKFAANALPMVENFKEKCAALNISEAYKTNFLKEANKMAPQYKSMFASWVRMQKAEQDFLQFLDDNFEGFQLKDGKIFFSSSTNLQKYAELVENVQDANKEAEEFQKHGMAAVEAAKRNLQ
jgi:hypothetical protein